LDARIPQIRKGYLKSAKAIAKGKPPILPATYKAKSEPTIYVDALNEIGSDFGPPDESLYEDGIKLVSREIGSRRSALSARDNVERTGQTIAQAIVAFRDYMTSSTIALDGSTNAWGGTQLTQLESWQNFLAEATIIKDAKKATSTTWRMIPSKAALFPDRITPRFDCDGLDRLV